MRIVIVGGVAAGVSTATRLRRLHESADIILFERGGKISFANCALPYHAGGLVPEQSLFAASGKRLKAVNAIDIRERHEVLSIDRAQKHVFVKNLETGEEATVDYDRLVLATGAEPAFPPIEGLSDFASPLWTVPDAKDLARALENHPDLRVGILGAGAVGLEAAENVLRCGGFVHLVEVQKTLLGANDPALSNAFVRLALSGEKKLTLHLGTGLSRVSKTEAGALSLELSNGTTLEVDRLICAAGVRPRSDLARRAGLALGPRGTILVDGHGRTSDPDIFAVGDVASKLDPETGAPKALMLAGPAVKQARAAADELAPGLEAAPLRGTEATSGVAFNGWIWATTGKNEPELLREGLVPRRDFFRATFLTSSRVAWYPGASPLLMKVLFDAGGKILGAAAIGREGADKRVDVIATAMHFGGTASDLAALDLCYCPQTGSPKDPVNVAGHIAGNILSGLAAFVEPWELRGLLCGRGGFPGAGPEDIVLLDVREPREIEAEPFPAPVLAIPLGELRGRLDEVPEDKTVVTICRRAVRAHTASRMLLGAGRRHVFILTGGMDFWKLALENPASP